jgi:hypothetical protein
LVKKLLSILGVGLVLAGICGYGPLAGFVIDGGDAAIASAFDNHDSGVDVTGGGEVVEVMADDEVGSRHQRFILKLSSGQTLLIAHNIDLAPRIPGLKRGDWIAFRGVYEWNSEGGVVHWTHDDPTGFREGGWVKRRW